MCGVCAHFSLWKKIPEKETSTHRIICLVLKTKIAVIEEIEEKERQNIFLSINNHSPARTQDCGEN